MNQTPLQKITTKMENARRELRVIEELQRHQAIRRERILGQISAYEEAIDAIKQESKP